MDPLVPLLHSSGPGYVVKASSPRGASSLNGICLQAEIASCRWKSSSSTENVPLPIDASDQTVPGLQDHSTQGSKRKTIHSPSGAGETGYERGISKKPKLETGEAKLSRLPHDKSHLPSEIWHHTFTFVTTKGLGVLLQVNKVFNQYLDPGSLFKNSASFSKYSRCVKTLEPDAIWQLSRRLHWPRMPAPLREKSELDMWRLCCANVCQRCGVAKPSQQRQEPLDPWHLGPGLDGLAVIFTFGVTSCGTCLLKDSVKEIDLLLSSTTPSSLMPVLAHVFVTNELQVVPSGSLADVTVHENTEPTKLYSVLSIESAKKELRTVQDLGAAAVEEWLKGLHARGKELRSDASRWERWTIAGGLALMNQPLQPHSSYKPNDSAQATAANLSASMQTSPGFSTTVANQESRKYQLQSNASLSTGHHLDSPVDMDWGYEHQGPSERRCVETAALRALRRVEIERRAMQIDPPLPPNLLVHMPSFQTAIQVTASLDDDAWHILLPKFLAERTDAERTENRTISKVVNASLDKKDGPLKEVTDKDWDDIQGPVRTRMSNYADDIIRNSWGKGRKVNKENSTRFAAEVLLSVRTRFYADVAQDAAAAIAAGQQPVVDPPEGPFTQKLTLENMKWVFDMKVKQHTESYRKELFLCNGCDNNRFYGFEGVVQHYAAKHTKALSLGNVVVYWRAEWPEQSPFKPNARPTKHSQQSTSLVPQNHVVPGHPAYNAYDALHLSGGMPPAPYYNFLPGHAPPPSLPLQHVDPYLPPPPYHMDGTSPPGPYPSGYRTNGIFQTYGMAPTAFGLHPAPPGPPEYSPVITGPPYPDQLHLAASMQGNHQPPYIATEGIPLPLPYRLQMEELARSARDIWNVLSCVKDLPGPVRVYVTVHHVVKRFHSKFSEAPSLRMFNDGLSNNKEMRPVRNINGLMCKSCTVGLGQPVNPDRKTFSLPQLVNHFENRHLGFPEVDYSGQLGMDWTQDMVLLPEVSEMPDLRAILGNKGQKFNLINEAVPWVFNRPSTSSSRPPRTWPPSCDQKQGARQSAEYDRYSQGSQSVSHGNEPSHWTGPALTQDPSNLIRGQNIQRQPPHFGCEDLAAADPHEPFIDSNQARDTRSQGGLPSPSFHQSVVWNGSPRTYDQPYEDVHNGRGYYGAIEIARHRITPYGSDRAHVAKEGRRLAHKQFRARTPPLVELMPEHDDRYRTEEEHVFRAPGRAGSVKPRPAPERARVMPQTAQLGPAERGTRVPHSAGVLESTFTESLLEGADESNLADAHLAQNHDVHTQKHENGSMIIHSNVAVRRNVTHKRHQPGHHTFQRGSMEVVDGCWQERPSRQPREPYRTHRLGSDSYEAAYTQSPAAGLFPGDQRGVAHPLTEETRTSPVQYEETYEIVHVRDAEGEYVIRRPILRGHEPSRTLYEDNHHRRLGQGTYPSAYVPINASAAVREGSPGAQPASARMREASDMSSRIMNDPSFYEEYDPRNPGPVPGPSAARYFGYGHSACK